MQADKSICNEPVVNDIVKGGRLNNFPLRARIEQGYLMSPFSFRIVQIRKAVRLFLFADNIIIYTEYPKDSTKELLKFTKYSNITGHRFDMQKVNCISIY